MFGAYVRENRKVVIALAVYTAVFAFIFWLYRLPLGAVGYAALVCLFLLLVWLAVDYRRFAVRLRLLRRLEQEITLSTEQLPEPDGALEAQYQALVRALDADRRARLTRSQQGYQELVEYYTVWAHQIKTPISAMRLMLGEEDTPRSRALSAELFRIDRYAEMALNYARLNSTSNDLVFAKVEVEPVIKRVVRQYAGQFVRKHIALKCDIAPVQVLTDEKWLAFILGQLLANAVKYTESGTVTVTVTKNKVLKVSDTGIGIAPEDLPRIFEKGFTGYNGRAEKKSTGLGMYLSRRAADMLGHMLSVQSAPGAGSTFSLDMKESNLQVE